MKKSDESEAIMLVTDPAMKRISIVITTTRTIDKTDGDDGSR